MRKVQSEYGLKGIFIGLWLYVALQSPGWSGLGEVVLWMFGGLVIALGLAAIRQRRWRRAFAGGPLPSLLFLILEYPLLLYAGLILGLTFGAFRVQNPERPPELLTYCALGGGILGLVLSELHSLVRSKYRLVAVLIVAAAGSAGATYWLLQQPFFPELDRSQLGFQLILGLPFFYLLSFAGRAEESEVEIAILCGVLGLGVWLVRFPENLPELGLLVPLLLYYMYATYALPGLRTFKYVLRGYSYLQMDRIPEALRAFRRARELDPRSQLAIQGLRDLHLSIDVTRYAADPDVLEVLDYPMCLHRIRDLLASGEVPNAAQREEAERLLELVESQRPAWQAETTYYRTLFAIHTKDLETAATLLAELLDPDRWEVNDASRRRILLDGWRLALEWHPDLRQRVGEVQLTLPGRRMEAIRVVERYHSRHPEDDSIEPLRRHLYGSILAEEYFAVYSETEPREVPQPDSDLPSTPSVAEVQKASRTESGFDYSLTYALGLEHLKDPLRWQRGVEYLRIAAHGLIDQSPQIYSQLADAYAKVGEMNLVRIYLEQAVKAGLQAGVEALREDQRQAYFIAVKRLADDAASRDDIDAAIEHYSLYTQSGQEEVPTYRTLADLYERKQDFFSAMRITEKALVHASKDADLLARKDRYYYALTPEILKNVREQVRPYFDTSYCKRVARQILNAKTVDIDQIDWAWHLAQLARIMEPDSLAVQVLVARCQLRRGERQEATQLLEDIREASPGGGEEEDAWYWACQQLGRMYLEEYNRPDLAIAALLDFKKSHKSGADTSFYLGQAYEQNGELAKAIRCFEQVTAYENHPLSGQAYDALERVRAKHAANS